MGAREILDGNLKRQDVFYDWPCQDVSHSRVIGDRGSRIFELCIQSMASDSPPSDPRKRRPFQPCFDRSEPEPLTRVNASPEGGGHGWKNLGGYD